MSNFDQGETPLDDHAPYRRRSDRENNGPAFWPTHLNARDSLLSGDSYAGNSTPETRHTQYWDDESSAAADSYDYGEPLYDDDDPPRTNGLRDDNALVRPYRGASRPRQYGTQRSLEEALVLWWSDGRLPQLPVLRDGLLMLEAGLPVEESHRSLLLRTALYHRRGMLTALKYQNDPERTALIMREAMLDGDSPLPPDELIRSAREDAAGPLWIPVLETELVTASLSPDVTRKSLAIATLARSEDVGTMASSWALFDPSELRRSWLPRLLNVVLLLVLAVVVAGVIGWIAFRGASEALIAIPAGPYALLNPDGSTRLVTLSEFQISRHEVTNGDYRQCTKRGRCPEPRALESSSRHAYFTDPAFDAYPVVNVAHADAAAYCDWINGRLPTESEWQVAASYSPILARALHFPWGDRFQPGMANSVEVLVGDTLQVGHYHPAGDSRFGLTDMAGNVAEWTMSFPAGDAQQFYVKGGSFADSGSALQSHLRRTVSASTFAPWLGFRCAGSSRSWLP